MGCLLWVWSMIICSPDSKVNGANMWLTWVLSAPDGPQVGPMNLPIRVILPLSLFRCMQYKLRLILQILSQLFDAGCCYNSTMQWYILKEFVIFWLVYVATSLLHEGDKLDKTLSPQPFMTTIEVMTVDNIRDGGSIYSQDPAISANL